MNTNPNATRILCFGDSNTWGRGGANNDRFLASERWTGILQQKLGPTYEILEEGLRSRTADLDDYDEKNPGRNGATYLRPCLESHYPTDLVILWLGTNDLKKKFDRQPKDIAQAIKKLVTMIKTVGKTATNQSPQILLISPPLVREEVLKTGSQFIGAGEKSKQLGPLLKQLASEMQIAFIDLAESTKTGDADGVHLEKEMHQLVAEEFLKIINSIQHSSRTL